MTHTRYYTSQDIGGSRYPHDTWSVYSELYANKDDDNPIDGTDVLIEGGFTTYQDANARVTELYGANVEVTVPMVTLSLSVHNVYEDGYEETNEFTDVQVPAPTDEDFASEEAGDGGLSEWADTELSQYAGTDSGRNNVDAGYFTTITASSDPRLDGKEFESYG